MIFSSFTLQRSAISSVRASTGSYPWKTCAISSALLTKNWLVWNFMRLASVIDLPVWMQTITSCACGVVFAEVVAVVGGDQRNAEFLLQTEEVLVDALLLRQALVLDFEEEIAAAEDVLKLGGRARA